MFSSLSDRSVSVPSGKCAENTAIAGKMKRKSENKGLRLSDQNGRLSRGSR